eukprot:TRINITY_DN17132_c0_g1_i2.p1 TRINITY_DN17132_c0_g1~~TRINITY_DN17132_c0_g1_i2.p1  ORF type:complete len:359 (+),score=67.39 TRINITY_DN17132_c0_g1_i2:85-1161(+)
MELASTMQAWQCESYNFLAKEAEHALKLVGDVQVPVPQADEILVKVHVAAVDRFDVKMLTGEYKDRFPTKDFPYVPGFDVAGEVIARGPECSKKFEVGNRVVLCLGVMESVMESGCNITASGPGGALAEYCVCQESQISRLPDELDFAAVAGLPLSGLTAYQCLFTGHGTATTGESLGSVQQGSKVLILGGDRSVGHLALQMAKQKGATVVTTVPHSKIAWMEKLGADQALDFRETSWLKTLRNMDFDLVLDCVGWAASVAEMDKIAETMGARAQFISMTHFELFELSGGFRANCSFKAMVPTVNSTELDSLVRQVADGNLQVRVDHVFPFLEARRALHACEATGFDSLGVGFRCSGW